MQRNLRQRGGRKNNKDVSFIVKKNLPWCSFFCEHLQTSQFTIRYDRYFRHLLYRELLLLSKGIKTTHQSFVSERQTETRYHDFICVSFTNDLLAVRIQGERKNIKLFNFSSILNSMFNSGDVIHFICYHGVSYLGDPMTM